MKRVLVVVAVVAAVALAVDVLGDMTQTRPDEVNEDAVTEIVVDVDEDRFGCGRDAAADALWAVCSAQTSSRMTGDGRLDALGDGRYRVVLRPAVGDHDERKLVGCLEDLTVDRVLGRRRVVPHVPGDERVRQRSARGEQLVERARAHRAPARPRRRPPARR